MTLNGFVILYSFSVEDCTDRRRTRTHSSVFMCEGAEPSWARPCKDSSLPAFVLALESASLELQEHKLRVEWAEGAELAFPGQVLTLYYFL